MVTTRDYYDILGISKNSTKNEIKQAYRRLALKWHPDKHKQNKREAENRFKEINEAYQVLSDPQKRQAYDQFGHAAFAQGGFGDGQGPFGGATRTGQYGPFTYTYTTSGSGLPFEGFDFGGFADPFDIFEQFFGGSPFGVGRQPRKPVYSLTIDFMEAVKGVGKQVDVEGKAKTIKIPAGVNDGTRIRFDDFDVVVSVKKHHQFKRDGNDILVEQEVDFVDVALGSEIEVPTIDGNIKLRIKPGTQPGSLMRLRGKGVPDVRGGGRGDQYVRINVQVPTRLSRRQRQILEEYKRES